MKKLLFTIALTIIMSVSAMAQNNDAFFNNWARSSRDSDPSIVGLMMPNTNIGDISNSPAPLGGGLLVLTALGGAYAVSRKRKNN